MKYVYLSDRKARAEWLDRFSRAGEVTMVRGGAFLLKDDQTQELDSAGIQYDILTREELDRRWPEERRATA